MLIFDYVVPIYSYRKKNTKALSVAINVTNVTEDQHTYISKSGTIFGDTAWSRDLPSNVSFDAPA